MHRSEPLERRVVWELDRELVVAHKREAVDNRREVDWEPQSSHHFHRIHPVLCRFVVVVVVVDYEGPLVVLVPRRIVEARPHPRSQAAETTTAQSSLWISC